MQTGPLLLQPLIGLTVEPLCYVRMTQFLLFQGDTPLIHAAREGHTHAAELLLAKGADVNSRDEDVSDPAQACAHEIFLYNVSGLA